MKWLLTVVVIIVVLAAGYYFLYGKNGMYSNTNNNNTNTNPDLTPVAQITVEVKNLAFTPRVIKVNVGDTVTFTNSDTTPHTVSSSTFDSGEFVEGQSFKRTFDTAGTYDYHCSLHPFMTGQVVVQ